MPPTSSGTLQLKYSSNRVSRNFQAERPTVVLIASGRWSLSAYLCHKGRLQSCKTKRENCEQGRFLTLAKAWTHVWRVFCSWGRRQRRGGELPEPGARLRDARVRARHRDTQPYFAPVHLVLQEMMRPASGPPATLQCSPPPLQFHSRDETQASTRMSRSRQTRTAWLKGLFSCGNTFTRRWDFADTQTQSGISRNPQGESENHLSKWCPGPRAPTVETHGIARAHSACRKLHNRQVTANRERWADCYFLSVWRFFS